MPVPEPSAEAGAAVPVAPVPERVPDAPVPAPNAERPEAGAPPVVDPPLTVGAVVALVAIPSIVAPRPAPPAEAVPVVDPPLAVPGGELTPTVGVLVSVALEVDTTEGERAGDVLVRVVLATPVVVDEAGDGEFAGVDPTGLGNVTAPVPTCPLTDEPGVGPPTGSDAVGLTVCAAAGSARPSDAAARSTRTAFMPRQHRRRAAVPDRWLRRGASGTVALSRSGI